MSTLLNITVERQSPRSRPEHHIVESRTSATWSSYLPSWKATSGKARNGSKAISRSSSSRSTSSRKADSTTGGRGRKRSTDTEEITGFCNPWPSWHKPSRAEVWQALEWGEDPDPCIELARRRIGVASKPALGYDADIPKSVKKQAAQLLHVAKPDFTFDGERERVKTTWLGHAGILIQLPPLARGDRPIRCLFDPIFSQRCSPTQSAGPIRSYSPPCAVDDLPEIDVLMLSHDHYDHLDYDTIMALWKRNAKTIRFVVPLGNREWFVDCGIDRERITELDWWDAVILAPIEADETARPLKITCTPSQHNSGRSGTDGNASLWASWHLDYCSPSDEPLRIFFAGDSGYQFHASPGWPPPPPASEKERSQITATVDDDSPQAKYPVCPAFQEIASQLGAPHLLLLPIAVGATYDFVRSLAPLPDSVNPIPRHSPGLTAANHMPPWDAVRVLQAMTRSADLNGERPVAIAMHWGTFVTDPMEVLKTLGQLEWACEAHGVRFARSLEAGDGDNSACFVALNHGESVVLR